MIYQDQLIAPQTVALWAGDFETEDEFATYLGQPFERDFGFLLDVDDLPDDSLVFPERRTRARYNELLQKVSARTLLSKWSGEDWIAEGEQMCLASGLPEAKLMIRFLNLRYPEEMCRNGDASLRFVGNVQWPGGRRRWEELQNRTMHVRPFPLMTRHRYEDGRLSCWKGRVHLDHWKGFATREELADEFMNFRFSAWPDGDFHLNVEAATQDPRVKPTAAQVRAFEHLLESQEILSETVLQSIFALYPKWRDMFGEMLEAEVMPPISQAVDLKQLIRLGTVHVMMNEKEGFTAVGFGFHCKWDDEHGLGVLTHKGKVLEVGAAETGFSELS
jgi:hypothetical protein